MALAPFFDKAALSAATLLRGFDRAAFEERLNAVRIGVVFGPDSPQDFEHLAAVELLMNLLSRLYPALSLVCLGSNVLLEKMRSLALRINPQIEIRTDCEGVSFVVATVWSQELNSLREKCPIVFISSDAWLARANTSGPMNWGKTQNIFGAAAAAAIAAANIFRHIFRDQLANPNLDEEVRFNLFDYSINSSEPGQSCLEPTDVTGTTLIGAGAIGNAVIWMFQRLPCVIGALTVIDHEPVELSNLRRYILTDIESIGVNKVRMVENALSGTAISVRPFPGKWASYLESSDWHFPRLAVAVDSVEERIKIAGSLPREILNAWTQADEVGISRHNDFGEDACLCCLYFPERQFPSESDIISEAIGLPKDDMTVRDLLQTGKPVDRPFLEKVAAGLGIAGDELFAFDGKPLRHFYSQAVCGGMVLRLGARPNSETEVPMAFQSALAGILLAAEIVISANRMRKSPLLTTTRVRVLEALHGSLLVPVAPADRCICRDVDYRSAFARKYGLHESL